MFELQWPFVVDSLRATFYSLLTHFYRSGKKAAQPVGLMSASGRFTVVQKHCKVMALQLKSPEKKKILGVCASIEIQTNTKRSIKNIA